METKKVDSPAAAATSPSASTENKGSQMRLIILLGVLVVALGALAYDHFVAKPAVLEAYDKIHRLVDETNAQAAAQSTRLTSEVIQKEIGKAPTKRIETEDYTVEYFCWWGPVPFLNTYRQYITVVYVGDEPRRFNSHHMNEYPPEEHLDPQFFTVTDEGGDIPPEEGAEPYMPEDAGGADAPGEAPGEGGAKKGKKKKAAAEDVPPSDAPPAEEPATSEPATSEPAITEPTEPAAADEPASSDDKPTDKEGDGP